MRPAPAPSPLPPAFREPDAGELGRRCIGLLALQGDYEAHARAFAEIGAPTRTVTLPAHLQEIDSLVLPGGESTTLNKLLDAYGFRPALAEFQRSGKPLFGTCAGLILLAREIVGYPEQARLGFIDLSVERNAFGRQVESFETLLEAPALGPEPLPAVFIRAPRIVRLGPEVEPLARLGEECVLARQGSVLVASFHPELTADRRVQRLFLSMGRPREARLAA